MKSSDKEILKKIVKYCDDIDLLMKQYASDYSKYKQEIAFQYSCNMCNMCIIQIGELVSRLSEEFVSTNNQIPWRLIKGMRNLHAHDYENVDLEIVWNTLIEDIPALKTGIYELIQ